MVGRDMGSAYSSVPDTNVSADNGKHSDYIWAAATMRGWRKHQEDRYQTVMGLTPEYSYFAVFDGHGGFEVAEYMKMKFHEYIAGYLELQPGDIEVGLQMGFVDFDCVLRHPAVIAAMNKMIAEAGTSAAAEILRRGGMPDKTTLAEMTREALGAGSNTAGGSGSGSEFSSTSSLSSFSSSSSDLNAPSTSRMEMPKLPVISEESEEKQSSSGSKEQGDIGATSSSKEEGIAKEQGDSKPSDTVSAEQPSSSAELKEAVPGPSQTAATSLPSPLEYLLNDELASTDTDDSDFEVDEEESLSEDEDEGINSEAFMKQEPGDFSGTTATIVIVGDENMYIANVGDSKCVMSRGGLAVDLTVDHNLDNIDERNRVIANGATVSLDGRVNNSINISRAFGDFNLKGGTDIPADQPVTAEPHIKTVHIENDDDFVIIASDGVWNSFSSQQLVDFVGQRIRAKDGTLIDICEEVFHLIIPKKMPNDETGCDNMTMIIIKLNAADEHDYLYVEPDSPDEDSAEEIEVDEEEDEDEEDEEEEEGMEFFAEASPGTY